jgi:photosystem II stability/assembly factor-like uncharacterized protein
MKMPLVAGLACALMLALPSESARCDDSGAGKRDEPFSSEAFKGLKFRSIGPAVTSGRVSDIAVDPRNRSRYFVAAASGGVWKTVNAGTTWEPVFDGESSYSIGCLAIDPNNPSVVWVGTGENNSQRSVSYGDGVYRSGDGGKSWENTGLKASEHIGKIVIDPRSSAVVYVAAQGPLWGPGGDRGLYKTTDAGKTWKLVLAISENTGVSDLVMDPRTPDVLYAAAYERRRHVWTLIDGGPESAIHKSTDGGATWTKLSAGLPSGDVGRIGLAISPVNPDIVYAVIELPDSKGGFYRSTDRGASWEKRGDYVPGAPQYYNKIYCDPVDVDRVYSMDVYLKVTDDGGKTFRNLGEKSKHVDNHAFWVDPKDPAYYLDGCDGGVYESFDRGETWAFKPNLPITQFYRVEVDAALPFYNVYGGTQDNFSVGGPSRTTSASGIENSDWIVTATGDGFVSRIDPEDPNTVYSESQYGGLVRFDRKSGELMGIQPAEGPGEPPLRWNWDSPLIISPHSHTRLYFAANILFRSDDRGNTWRKVSGDLTRKIDRNSLPVMGKMWGVDAVAKSTSTSLYGNCVALAESPLKEGLLYVGTDDGLLQVSEDGGATWREVERFPGVPHLTYVSCVATSHHDARRLYIAFDNHKNADFHPYLLRSDDAGRSWTTVAGDLPSRGTVYTVAEDPVNRNLLFAGTEFGVFFTIDGGKKWDQLKGGLPTIAVRDIAIQKRESDLVLGTFGRGFYILDDYTPLRSIMPEALEQQSLLFPVKNALMYIESRPHGLAGKGFLGETFYEAPNPPFGATFTYYLRDSLKTRAEIRKEKEKELVKKGERPPYPSYEELRREDDEEPPSVTLTVTDESGNVVRRLGGPVTKGFSRVTWDLRYSSLTPERLKEPEPDAFSAGDESPLTMPGMYTVRMSKTVEGATTEIAGPVTFSTSILSNASLPAADRKALVQFQRSVASLQRAVLGASQAVDELKNRLVLIKKALTDMQAPAGALRGKVETLEASLRELTRALRGDRTLSSRSEPVPKSLDSIVNGIVDDQWQSSGAPTQTQRDAYNMAGDRFAPLLARLHTLAETDLKEIENQMEGLGAPWTPGRIPDWKK